MTLGNFPLSAEDFELFQQHCQELGLEVVEAKYLNRGVVHQVTISVIDGFEVTFLMCKNSRVHCEPAIRRNVVFAQDLLSRKNSGCLIWPNSKLGLQGFSNDWPFSENYKSDTRKAANTKEFLEALMYLRTKKSFKR